MLKTKFLSKFIVLFIAIIVLSGCQFIKDLYEGEEGVSYVPLGEIPIEEELPENFTPEIIEIIEEVEVIEIIEEEIEEVEVIEAEEGAIVIIASETELVSLQPKAEDPDADKLSYTYTSPLDNNGKWQTSYGDAGEYTITVSVSDGELSSSQDVLLIVNRKEEAPTINAYTPDKTTIVIEETGLIDFSVSASDLNKDSLSYNWKLDGKDVSNTESFSYQTSYDDSGAHTVKFDVSDGKLTTTQLWSVTVDNVNRAPVLEQIDDISVKETETVEIKLKAQDPDGDEISFTIEDPIGDDGVWETGYDDAGEYTITVSASDGIDETSQDVRVIVENVNRPPVITDIVKG